MSDSVNSESSTEVEDLADAPVVRQSGSPHNLTCNFLPQSPQVHRSIPTQGESVVDDFEGDDSIAVDSASNIENDSAVNPQKSTTSTVSRFTTSSILVDDFDDSSSQLNSSTSPIQRSMSVPSAANADLRVQRQSHIPASITEIERSSSADHPLHGRPSVSRNAGFASRHATVGASSDSSSSMIVRSGSNVGFGLAAVARSLSRKEGLGYTEILADIASLQGVPYNETDANYIEKQQQIAAQFTRHDLSKIVDFFNGAFKCSQFDTGKTAGNSIDTERDPENRSSSSLSAPAGWIDTQQCTAAVVVMGSINMDLIATTATFPKANSNQPGRDFKTIPGGKGANEAVACGRLGATVWMIGRVGNDDFGRIMMTRLSADANVEGISFDDSEGTGVAMIITAEDTGDKTTTTCQAANMQVDNRELEYLQWYIKMKPEIRFLLTVLEINTETVCRGAKIAHDAGKIVTVRASPVATHMAYPEELWDYTDIVILGEWEAPILLEKQIKTSSTLEGFDLPLRDLRQCVRAAELLLDLRKNVVMVVITTAFGLVGRIRINKAKAIHNTDFHVSDIPDGEIQTVVVPHFKANIVDVIGAADALTGAMVAALAHGVPVLHSLVWGTISSMHSLEATGAQESMPTLSALREFMQGRNIGVHAPWMAKEELGPTVEAWPSFNPVLDSYLNRFSYALHSGASDELGLLLREYDHSKSTNCPGGSLDTPIDFQGQTLLHVAVMYADIVSVCHLLTYGARLDVRDAYGYSPLDRSHDMAPKSRTRLAAFSLIKLAHLATWMVNCFFKAFNSNELQHHKSLAVLWTECEFTDSLGDFCRHFDDALKSILVKDANADPDPNGIDEGEHNTWIEVLLYMMSYPLGATENATKELADLKNFDADNQEINSNPIRELGCALLHKVLNKIHLGDASKFQHVALIIEAAIITGPNQCRISALDAAAFAGDAALIRHLARTTKRLLQQCENSDKLSRFTTQRVIRQRMGKHLASPPAAPLPVLISTPDSKPRSMTLPKVAKSTSGTSNTVPRVAKGGNGCVTFRSPLHYAALGGNLDCATELLSFGLDLYDKDSEDTTPLDLCHSQAFAINLERIGLKNDTFISVGHTTETDHAVNTFANHLQEHRELVVWWDKNERRGIAPGESWTKEITQAMRHSKTCVVMLTRKWLSSEFCTAEAKIAFNFNKPVFAVLPPVPEDQRVTLADIPSDHFLYHQLRHRQHFNFVGLNLNDEEALDQKMGELTAAIKNCTPTVNHRQFGDWDDARGASISEVNMPPGPLYKDFDSSRGYVVIAAGVAAPAKDSNLPPPFAELLGSTLHSHGIPQAIAYQPNHETRRELYWAKLNRIVEEATLMLVVLEQDSDRAHQNRVLEIAKTFGKSCMMVPYTTLANDESGLIYTANVVAKYTCCFTNWTSGDEVGLNKDSPAFNDFIQHNFLHTLDQALNMTD